MKISQNHSNRHLHNWLIYDINDAWLAKYTHLYKGMLYDLGCGEAPYKNWFLNFADHYVGVDWSDSLHNIQADLNANLSEVLPIDNAVAETVVSISVMEHLSDPQLMLCEAFRILKPGGNFIAQVPWQWGIHEDPYDFFRFTPYGLENLLSSAGFEDIVIQPQSGCFTMLAMKFNYLSKRLIRGPRVLQYILKLPLYLIWYLTQKIAPLLDTLDKNWNLETTGYFIIARKKI